jgi:CheY-like chemotaxis protein
MAPETIAAEVKLGHEHLVDLYAIGVIAFQLLTGKVPFIGSVNDVLLSQVIDTPPDLATLRPDAPAPLRSLVARLLSKGPEERPHTAEAVLVELKAIAEHRLLLQATREVFVLIVDDDRVSSRVLDAIVRKAIPNVEVAAVGTGDEALAQVTKRMPNILLLDIQLPGMSGVEVAMYLRGMQSINTCTIVAISGTAEEEDRLLLRDLGIVHFLRKSAQLHVELPALLLSLESNIADRKSSIPIPMSG